MSTDLITIAGDTMGTRYAVQFPEGPFSDRATLQHDLHLAVASVDQQMSPWITTSIVNQINATPVGEWMKIPTQTAQVIEKALEIERKSNAAFSIAVAPQVRHYGFSTMDRDFGDAPQIGSGACDSLELKGLYLRKSRPIEIDLCGIAKGYGVDVLAEIMIKYGIRDFMVSIDGELRCLGAPAPDQTWQVAIEAPVPAIRESAGVIPCAELALATSGGYRNFDLNGEEPVTHTIDPRTGLPLPGTSNSVVVAHKYCCDADAWATALLVMPIEEAEGLIIEQKLNALFLKYEGSETLFVAHGAFA